MCWLLGKLLEAPHFRRQEILMYSTTRELIGVRRGTSGHCLAALLLLAIGAFMATPASAFFIISEAKLDVVSPTAKAASASDDLVAIDRNNAWQVNNPLGRGAVWVSNADTGQGGALFQPGSVTAGGDAVLDVIFRVTEEFTIAGGGHIDFTIWADDTARVFFDDVLVSIDPNFTQGTCAVGPIGCQPDEFFNFSMDIAAGIHKIAIDTYQVGTGTDTNSNPFGLLYSGEVTVPEPATLLLLGMGLVGLGFRSRNRKLVV
ncbi:MAG: PEP-CTERM sorting domain-containing protein [Lysobacterales bacterium]|nr:MAG: PEP-CTERM sorting domain-containing protein [Xanthomonadales bacterium]